MDTSSFMPANVANFTLSKMYMSNLRIPANRPDNIVTSALLERPETSGQVGQEGFSRISNIARETIENIVADGLARQLVAKSLYKVNPIAAALGAGYDANQGYKQAGEIFNTKNPTLGQKGTSAAVAVLDGLTFGALMNQKNDSLNAYNNLTKAGNYAGTKINNLLNYIKGE